MEIVYDEADLRRYFQTAVSVSNDAPVLLDHFLDDAVEVDVDAICDGEMVLIGGIMEHIEQAGVHSGDSACSLPAYTLSQEIQDVMRQQVQKLAFELQVRGLMNVQFAVKNNEVYLIEVNPRAARTVPFVSKATGVPLAKVAAPFEELPFFFLSELVSVLMTSSCVFTAEVSIFSLEEEVSLLLAVCFWEVLTTSFVSVCLCNR